MTHKEKEFKRIIILVIDGLGIGEMCDTKNSRPNDVGANTAKNVIEKSGYEFNNFKKLGLHYLCGLEKKNSNILVSSSELKHFGADSFFGHQEIMGTNPIKPLFREFNYYIKKVKEVLKNYKIKYEVVNENPQLLLIENCFTIGDNIETDLGQAFNITADLNILDFEKVLEIAKKIRKVLKVPRLIVFGSKDTSVKKILECVEIKEKKFIGVNAPKSGVYTKTYQCVHLGYGVDFEKQASSKLVNEGHNVILIGKTADVITAKGAKYIPCVDTELVMNNIIKELSISKTGMIFANVQETDLAGHEQDVKKFGKKLKIVDEKLENIISHLTNEDLFIIMADHGDDPCIGHAQHTREKVPLMFYSTGIKKKGTIQLRKTMADIGQTTYNILTGNKLENGNIIIEVKKYSQ